MKNIFITLMLAGSITLGCQESANQKDNGNSVSHSQDTVTTGLEGTRDQSGTISGTEVKMDTSSGQGNEKKADSSMHAKKQGKDTIIK